MQDGITGESLAHLRHDLRTPLNHVLGYTEILLEEASNGDLADSTSVLTELRAGGRKLLEQIQRVLGDGGSSVSLAQLQNLESALRPETERLLMGCEALERRLLERGATDSSADVARISVALRRLLSLAGEIAGGRPDAGATDIAKETSQATPAAAQTKAAPETEAGAGGRILVVEDNRENRNILRRHLERAGHLVWEAANGVEALESLATQEFDLLLLDIMMPELDGFGVLARLKRNRGLRDLPVVMISAVDEVQSVVRCIQMGAEDYLPKPFDPVLLRARIGASLEKKRLSDRERRKTEELESAIEQLKKTQAQLVVQEKMASLGALTAGIAHEIKNPLNFVTNFAEVSVELMADLRKLLEPVKAVLPVADTREAADIVESLTGNLQRIREHSKRADRIVRSMLAHSRGGSGQPETVDVNSLVSESVNLAYHGLRASDSNFTIALQSDYDPTLPTIQGVPRDLSRVFLNIVNNACYAAHQKKLSKGEGFRPCLHVSTRHPANRIEIHIRDNGDGIPNDVLPRIFNPFYTTKPAGSGTGLGLSLSYQIIVDQHKGTIHVDTQEGEYTEFTVSLPV